MPSKSYCKGRAFEYRVMQLLEGQGYFCLRSAGSHGPADIVAIRDGKPILIQVQVSSYLPREKLYALKRAAAQAGCTAWLAYRVGKQVMFRQVHPDPPICPISMQSAKPTPSP